MTRHQVVIYLTAIALGIVVGSLVPDARMLDSVISPAIGVLLYATFLGVPFTRLGEAFRDVRFLVTLLVLNFVLVPVVVYALSRFVATDDAVLLGVLLVLLTPCVDYVIVFTGLAGGAHAKLVAAAPVLMIAQLLLLPAYLAVFAGPRALAGISAAPFVEAFVYLIAVPLLLAAATQVAARRFRPAAGILRLGDAAMVVLMALTLFVVVASQAGLVIASLGRLGVAIAIFVGFLVVMTFVGLAVSRAAHLDARSGRAAVFSGATRNSLVVLPLALALPAELALVPAVVVAQTLVELVGMVILVRVVPALLPARA